MPEVKNILDDVFKRPEKEVKYFVGVMSAPVEAGLERAKAGKVEKMKAAVFTTQTSGFIGIQHGWDGDDYVWHIEPIGKKKWKPSVDRAIYATAKTMNNVIPETIKVNIHRPAEEWFIKVFTFKAFSLKSCWNVTKEDIEKLNTDLFKVLNTLV